MSNNDKNSSSHSRTAAVPQTPALRFRGFAGEWVATSASAFIRSLDAGVSVNSGDRPAHKSELGVLKTSSVTNGVFEPCENKVVLSDYEKSRLREPAHGGTLIISRMNTPDLVGANAYVEESYHNLFLPDRLWAAKPEENTSMRFLALILGSKKGRLELSKVAKGTSGSMKNITKQDVLNFSVTVPSFVEQQKIGSFFKQMDSNISLHQAQLDKLGQLKQAMLQKMFPQGHATVPEIRFKGFAGEWKTHFLHELGDSFGGLTGKTKDDFGSGKPYVPYTNIFNNSAVDTKNLELVVIDENEKQNKIKYGDLLFTTSSETPDEVGMSSVLLEHVDNLYLNSFSFAVRLRNFENLVPEFARYLFREESARKKISLLAQGATRYNISKNQFMRLSFQMPSIDEQQKIAAYFSKLDETIELHRTQLDKLKQMKQACLSGIFT